MFDKLRFVKGVRAIKSLKLTQKEAEDFAQVVENAMTETVATKADIADLKSDMANLKAELKGEISAMEIRIVKWLIVQFIAIVGLMLTVLPHVIN